MHVIFYSIVQIVNKDTHGPHKPSITTKHHCLKIIHMFAQFRQ